jgi:hypothetical protein
VDERPAGQITLEKSYDRVQDQNRIADAGVYGVDIANSIRPAVQADQSGVFRTQVTKNQITSVIRETAQPEKPL